MSLRNPVYKASGPTMRLMRRTLIELWRVVVALVFAATAILQIVRMEWFDVLRWGPPSSHLGTVYVAYMVVAGLMGWSLAAALTSGRLWRQLASYTRWRAMRVRVPRSAL